MMPNSILASAHRLCAASSTIAAAPRLALVLGFTIALALSNPTSAGAQTQTYPCETVMQFGTGMSTSGTKLRPGSVDPSFQGTDATFLNPPNAYVLTDPPAAWIANSASADSQWIGPSSTIDDDIAGTSVYRLLIVSPCAGATLTGRYAASDRGVIRLNGQPISFPTPAAGWTTWTAFSFNNLLPGLNRLEFYITNSIPAVGGPPGPTGLRAELTVTATCCPCIVLDCPSDLFLTTCSNGAPANFSIAGTNRCFTNLTINCSLASITGVPVTSGFVFPVGTNTVICTASDTAGHRTNCTFRVTVNRDTQEPEIRCPQDIIYPCSVSGTNVYFNVAASDDTDPAPAVSCVPPSGSFFPAGTNTVVCTARDSCGNVARCSFRVVLAPDGFTKTLQAGVADDFALSNLESPDSGPCLGASGYWTALPFDTYFPGRHFSHSFQGLPNNLSGARLILRMKPRLASSQDDVLRIGLQNCGTAGVWAFALPVASLPGAGGTWVTNPPTTFTLDLATLPGGVNLLATLNANHRLEFAVGTETLVDYARLEMTYCGPQTTFSGVPYSLKNAYPVHQSEGVTWRTINSNGPPSTVEIDLAGADGFRLNYPGGLDAQRICDPLGPLTVVWPKIGGLTVTALVSKPGTNFFHTMVTVDQPGNVLGKRVEVWHEGQLVSRYFFSGSAATGFTVPEEACVASQGFAKDHYFVNFFGPEQINLLDPDVPATQTGGTHLSGQIGPVVTGTSVRLYFRNPIALAPDTGPIGFAWPSSPPVGTNIPRAASISSPDTVRNTPWLANSLSLASISLLHGEDWIEGFGAQQLTVSDTVIAAGFSAPIAFSPFGVCVPMDPEMQGIWTIDLNPPVLDFCRFVGNEMVCSDGELDLNVIKQGVAGPAGNVGGLRITPTGLPFSDSCHIQCTLGGGNAAPYSLVINRVVGGPLTLNNVSSADFSNWPLAAEGAPGLNFVGVFLPPDTVVTIGAQNYTIDYALFRATGLVGEPSKVCLEVTQAPQLSFKNMSVTSATAPPPCLTLTCPTNVIVNCTNATGTVVTFNPTAVTRCGSNAVITCEPPSGSLFPPGATVVLCSAIDSQGNQDQCEFLVTVLPTCPLTVTRLDRNRVELRWVGDAIVESTDALGERPVWRRVNGTPTSSGAESVLVLPIDHTQQFFRIFSLP